MVELCLEVKHLSKSFGKHKILDHVNFQVQSGHILGLLGRNGAGKTTLMKTILGLYPCYEGTVLFHDQPIEQKNQETKRRIGSLVQVAFYEDITAIQNLKMLSLLDGMYNKKEANQRFDELLKMVELEDVKKKKVKTFSFGMKQRLALAQAFINRPELLILDEPFIGLDPVGIQIMKKSLQNYCREYHTAAIFSSHQLADFEGLVDEVMVLKDGKIAQYDTYENIIEREGSLLELFQ